MTGEGLFGELLAWSGLSGPSDSNAADRAGEHDPPPPRRSVQPIIHTPLPFTRGPWPPEPDPEPEAPAPPQAAPRPFVAAPLPFPSRASMRDPTPEPGPPPTAAAPPPFAPAPLPFSPAPLPFTPVPWPFDPDPEPEPEAIAPRAVPLPHVPTPLPFAPNRVTFVPEPVIVLPKAARSGPRFGQMHAEATARATRYAAAHATEPERRAAGQRTEAPPSERSILSPRVAAIVSATAAYGAGAAHGAGAARAPAFASPAARARAEAIERALARGRAQHEATPPPAPTQIGFDSMKLGLGVTLVCVLLVEVLGGVFALSLANGYVMLAFGLALDACARTLGTVAAARTGKGWGPGWSWSCALLGSPAVVAFAFYDDGTLVDTDLAPLAGPIAAFAIVCIVIGLAGIPAGI